MQPDAANVSGTRRGQSSARIGPIGPKLIGSGAPTGQLRGGSVDSGLVSPGATARPRQAAASGCVPSLRFSHDRARAPGRGCPVERRIVSLLFADLVGFTPLAERLDAEDVATVQDAYFAATRETVQRYGGVLEKFIGDAAMAVFGAFGHAMTTRSARCVRGWR